jgi:hypothetical protein
MQQIYQQQMQAQANTTLSNEELKTSGLELPDVARCQSMTSGANPTTFSYNASAVKNLQRSE